MKTEEELVQLHKGSRRNRLQLKAAKTCGCFYCLREFELAQIVSWTGDGDTVICPFCGIDSVIGLEGVQTDETLLREMHDRWFGRSTRMTEQEWKKAVESNKWPTTASDPSKDTV